MNCPNCETVNPDGAGFCSNCGHSLTQRCPNCTTDNSLTANFCINCGRQLDEDSDAPQDKLLQYIPKELLEKLESARSGQSMAGERRVVTILFCDVKGSTAAAEQMDPEDWAEVMNGAFEHLISPVYRYEGTLARLMGDAVLAFFGAPIAHEDDPERAVLAGLEIVEGIGPYREETRARWNLDFNVRVGINTGLVVVGEVGSDLRMEYTAMGDAVNLASRMEQTAQPGTVQIAEETHKRVAPLFNFESLGEIEVKGKREPVPAYRVLGRKAEPGPQRGIQGLEAPVVGREPEMELLRESLDGLLSGQGGIRCLIADAGLGKSRMIQEVHQYFDNQGYWGESRGVSYETTRPYGQFQQHVERLFGISESDSKERIHEKLMQGSEGLDSPASANMALEALLGIGCGSNGVGLEGEALKRELFDANLRIWRHQADQMPTVLVFDDLHWADAASTELLAHLFQLTDMVPILFICAFRPDRVAPSWGIKQTAEAEFPHRYKEIVLPPLTAGDSQKLVDHLLTISDLPPKLHALIQAKSEGNPFFVEEVVRSLIDSGAVVQEQDGARWLATADVEEVQIPDNLQSLLISRIDRLEGEARRTLQIASVIGRSFYYRVLQSISKAVDELDSHLSVLQRVELILEAARDPEREYAFRHALTQEAAYRSILRRERSAYHLQAGEALEQLFPEQRTELSPILAHHFLQAKDPRGAEYSIAAGDEAFRMYAIEAAIRHYRNALTSDDSSSLMHAFTRLGRSHELVDQFEEAVEVYRAMADDGRERGNGEMELVALTERAKIYSIPNVLYSLDRAREYSNRALELARMLENHEAEARILWSRANSEKFVGESELAVKYGEQSLAVAKRYELREQLAFTLNDIAAPLIDLGELERAESALTQSYEIWQELDNKPMQGDNLSVQTYQAICVGDYEGAITLGRKGLEVTRSIENLWGQASSLIFLGFACAEAGKFGQALDAHEGCLRISQQIGTELPLLVVGSFLALTYGTLGAMEQAWKTLNLAQSVGRDRFRNYWPFFYSVAARLHLWSGDVPEARRASEDSYQDFKPLGTLHLGDHVLIADAEIALVEGRPEHALERLNEALKLAVRRGRRVSVPEVLMFKALSQQAVGDLEGARESLAHARQETEAIAPNRHLWRILLEQGRLEAEAGNLPEASLMISEAGAHVARLLDELEDPELRRSFEELPTVQEALS